MSCCNINKTSFALNKDITNNTIDINYDFFSNGIIRSFTDIQNNNLSGIWLPAYFTKNMAVESDQWIKASASGCKEGLGIQDFMTVSNPEFPDWIVYNSDLSVDWMVKIDDCREFDSVILFWYRYYDVNRLNDDRVFPSIDLYVSDGEFGFTGTTPFNSSNLATIKSKIYSLLLQAGYGADEALLRASILATSPQIDRLTENLCGPGDYERDELGRIKTFLQKMCSKRYSDIGTKNFPQNKYDLFKKLSQKYDQSLVFYPEEEGFIISKFFCNTGPNISIDISGDLFRNNILVQCGYSTDFGFDYNLRLKTQQNVESFSSSGVNHVLLNNAIIGKTLTGPSGIFDPNFTNVSFHGLGGVFFTSDLIHSGCGSEDKFSDVYFLQDYSVTNTVGIEQSPQALSLKFKPDSNSKYRLKNLSVSYLRSESYPECDSFIEYAKGKKKAKVFPIANYQIIIRYSNQDGPCPGGHCCDAANYDVYIGDRYIGNANMNNASDCGNRTAIINIPNGVLTNIDGSIDLSFKCKYTDCHGGVTWVQILDDEGNQVFNQCIAARADINIPLTTLDLNAEAGCNCYTVEKLSYHPSGIQNVDNSGQILYTPPTSMFNLPSGSFYGGLSNDQVLQNGIILPDHPVGDFPRIHKNFFPIEESCGLIVDGCNSKTVTYNIPYATELVLNHEAAGASFSLSWNGNTVATNGLVNQSDSLVLSKPLAEPSLVTIQISTAVASGTSDWGFELLAPQKSYNQISTLVGTTLWGYKGFFHPNSGWLDDSKYYNLSPLVPYHNNASNNFFYNSKDMYGSLYLPGYNFLFSTSGLSKSLKKQINEPQYIGISIDQSNSFFVTDKYEKFNYNQDESLILDNLILDYVNMDSYYGYIYNDFNFTWTSGTRDIIVSRYPEVDRARLYLDDARIKKDKLRLFSAINPNLYVDTNVISIDVSNYGKTTVTIDKDLSQDFLSGYLYRITDNDASVVVYGKNNTVNDSEILVGKWSNLSYGDAEKFKLSSIGRRFNNSALRTSGAANSSETWSSPFKIINNYDSSNITYYTPLTRLLANKSHQTLGYTNPPNWINDFAGDHIVSSGTLDSSFAYLYVGPYIGNMSIDIYLSSVANSNRGYVELYHNSSKIASKPFPTNSDRLINFTINKQTYTDPYVKVVLNDESSNCFGLNIKNVDLTLSRYTVKIDGADADLINKSRIAYYEHSRTKPSSKTYALGFDGQRLTNISPLSEKTSFTTQAGKNLSPYLDLHIFSSSPFDMPFVSSSGSIVFENLFKPKNHAYLSNMKYKYNKDLFWIDVSEEKNWSILTSKGILLRSDQVYSFVKRVSYYCDDDAKTCSSRYPKDICSDSNDIYSVSIEQIFDLLGLSPYDINFFEIKTISYPADCQTISYCCENNDTECLQKQQQAIDACVADWYDKKEDVSCENTGCVVDPDIEGQIGKSIEYYFIKVKKNIYPGNLHTKNENRFTFFNTNQFTNIPCINLNLPGLGRSFYYNFNCEYTSPKQCDYIIQPNLSGILSYVPGEFVDIAPYIYSQGTSVAYPVPSSVIFENEKRYREVFSHPNTINGPLVEYDKYGEINYDIIYNLNIKSSGCIGPGDICSLIVDDWSCSFQVAETGNSLLLTSTCFNDIFLKDLSEERNVYTDTFTEYNYDSEHSCPPYINATGLFNCSLASQYVQDNYGSDYALISCNKEFNSNKYTMLCQYCPPTGCSTMSITEYSYSGDECFCPDGFALSIDGYGNKVCSKDVEIYASVDGTTKVCATGPFQKELSTSSGTITLSSYSYPTCFSSLGNGSTSGEIAAYNQNCSSLPSGQYREITTTEKITQYATSYNCWTPIGSYNKAFVQDQIDYANAIAQADCDLQACINACGPSDTACQTNCYTTRNETVAAINNNRQAIMIKTCCNDVCTESQIGGGNGAKVYQDYTCDYTIKTREGTKTTKTKIPYFDQSLYASTVKRWEETFNITYGQLLSSPHECEDTECCSKANLDFTIQVQIFKNSMVISLAGQTICLSKDRPIFQCPRVSFTSLNDSVYLCDTVSVLTSNCEIGRIL